MSNFNQKGFDGLMARVAALENQVFDLQNALLRDAWDPTKEPEPGVEFVDGIGTFQNTFGGRLIENIERRLAELPADFVETFPRSFVWPAPGVSDDAMRDMSDVSFRWRPILAHLGTGNEPVFMHSIAAPNFHSVLYIPDWDNVPRLSEGPRKYIVQLAERFLDIEWDNYQRGLNPPIWRAGG